MMSSTQEYRTNTRDELITGVAAAPCDTWHREDCRRIKWQLRANSSHDGGRHCRPAAVITCVASQLQGSRDWHPTHLHFLSIKYPPPPASVNYFKYDISTLGVRG